MLKLGPPSTPTYTPLSVFFQIRLAPPIPFDYPYGAMAEAPSANREQYELEVRKHFPRNYTAHCLDGAFFTGGVVFVAADTVMPAMINSLGGSDWLIALMPQMMMLGFLLPPLMTAHRVERMDRLKGFILLCGAFQRLPFLLAALALIFFADSHPGMVLLLAAFVPMLSGLAGGVSIGAWLEMTSRLIPARRRSSGTAIRCISGAVIGIGAGEIIRQTLEAHPGPVGFGILHLWAFGVLCLSFISFCLFKEVPKPFDANRPKRNLVENLRAMPALLRSDPLYRRFITVRILSSAPFVLTPFLGLHAVSVTGGNGAFLGAIVQAQTLGGIVGNIASGWMGDRYGGRLPMKWSQVGYLLVCIGAVFSHSEWAFLLTYLLLGAAQSGYLVGQQTLAIELSPDDRRPSYFALISVILFVGMLFIAGLSTLLQTLFASVIPAAIVVAIAMIGAHFMLEKIPEPRNRTAKP